MSGTAQVSVVARGDTAWGLWVFVLAEIVRRRRAARGA
jgi:hypothetical protein